MSAGQEAMQQHPGRWGVSPDVSFQFLTRVIRRSKGTSDGEYKTFLYPNQTEDPYEEL